MGAAFKMESCILPTVAFVLSLLRRSGGCMSRACCGVACVVSLRCIYACCVHNGWCCSCTCLPALSVVVFVFFSHGPSCVVLFAFGLSCLPSLSSFSPCLFLFLCLSLSLSLPPCLSSGNGTNIIKRNAWTQTLERCASFLYL